MSINTLNDIKSQANILVLPILEATKPVMVVKQLETRPQATATCYDSGISQLENKNTSSASATQAAPTRTWHWPFPTFAAGKDFLCPN